MMSDATLNIFTWRQERPVTPLLDANMHETGLLAGATSMANDETTEGKNYQMNRDGSRPPSVTERYGHVFATNGCRGGLNKFWKFQLHNLALNRLSEDVMAWKTTCCLLQFYRQPDPGGFKLSL